MREQHELSKAFPPMSEEEYQDLKDSIEIVGLLDPVTIYDEKVIDGWHRYTACLDVGMPPIEVDLPDDVDPVDFVRAKNGRSRRHLTKSQLAITEVTLYEWRPEGRKANSLPSRELKSAKELAESAGVSVATIEQAKQVVTKASEEVIDAVKKGKVSVKKAASVSKLPKEKQAKALTERTEPKHSLLDGNGPSDEELEANERRMQAELQAVADFLDADDKMSQLWEENKKLRHNNAGLEARNSALMREKNECIKLCKKLQNENDKLKGKK